MDENTRADIENKRLKLLPGLYLRPLAINWIDDRLETVDDCLLSVVELAGKAQLPECVIEELAPAGHLGGTLNMTTSVLWYGARVTASFFPSGDQS